ncbi:MAG: SusC/RagA family TonB-linked outer membrane protein [Candidatus Nephrothrix sp. EaCA]|nr:MAG: SusC/RagA family TonB-linked outer membrane protein [Candidatus Nephrothrix sp. EaCA]
MNKFLFTFLSFGFALSVWAQNRVVTGTLTSKEDGSILPGVNVVLKGTTNGTVTNSEGNYKLPVPSTGGVLIFSYMGFHTQEVDIAQRAIVDVQLETGDSKQLNEVVVTALGEKVDKDKFASSVTTVQGTNVVRSGETGALQGLSGKAAGVLITRNGGDPGSGAYIQIRGQNTINGNSQPLFIVDGIPVSNSNEYGLSTLVNSINPQSRINDINPEDIASVEVLKGASAAAVWGTRAANGVIIITTKKGSDSKGKVNISYKATVSFDKVNKMHPLQTAYGSGTDGNYIQGNKETWGDKISDRSGEADTYITNPNASGYAGFVTFPDGTTHYAIASGKGSAPNWDGTGVAAHGGKNSRKVWDHRYDAFQTGHYVDNNLTISGGNARTSFLISYSNLSQEGIVKSFSNYYRNSARINASSQFTEWFKASASASYVSTSSTRALSGDNVDGLMLGSTRSSPDFNNNYYTGNYTDPTGAVYPNTHVSYRNPLGMPGSPKYSNPLWNIHNNKNTSTVPRFLGNIELRADPTSWLNIVGRVGIDAFTDRNPQTFPQYSANYPKGYYQVSVTSESQFNSDFFATALKQFNKNFSISFMAGVNFNDRKRETDYASLSTFTTPSAPPNLNNGLNSNLQAYNYFSHIRTLAYYAHANLSAYDQLYLTLTGRSERASAYANSFFFPSASLAWQFTKLGALQAQSILSFGKLRVTWGKVGIQPQPYLGLTTAEPSSYGGLKASSNVYGGGFTQSYLLGNASLKPERKTETEVGFDLRFLDNRLSFSATAYYNQTKDVIISLNLPAPTGFNQQNRNAAVLENKGLELEMGYDIIKSGNFIWNIGSNWAANRNKVVSLAGSAAQSLPDYGGSYGGTTLIAGQPFGIFYGTDFLRDITGKYTLDANGFPQGGTQNEIIGNPNPAWRGGISTMLSFKSISVYVLFDKVYGNDYWNGTRGALYTFGTHADTGTTSVAPAGGLKTYTGLTIREGTPFRGKIQDFGGGPVALTQDWYQGIGSAYSTASVKQFVEDGGSTRLRELTINYSLNNMAFKKWTKLSSVNFSLTGRNLFLWTKYSGVDPDTNISGASLARGQDWFTNPSAKSILFTINVTY